VRVKRYKDGKGKWRRYWFADFGGVGGKYVRRSTGVEWRSRDRGAAEKAGERLRRLYWEVEAVWRCQDMGLDLEEERGRWGARGPRMKRPSLEAVARVDDELRKAEAVKEFQEPVEEKKAEPKKEVVVSGDEWVVAGVTGHPRIRLMQGKGRRERRKLLLDHSAYQAGVGKTVKCEEGERGMLKLRGHYDKLWRTEGDLGYGRSRI